jgi:hypothetical protein
MKKITLIGLLIIGVITTGCSESLEDKIKFASIEKANGLLIIEDEFTKSWSQFDIDSRMQKQNSSRKELFTYITEQTRDWTFEEKNVILTILKNIDEQINKQGFKIDFPDVIYFIKTTTNEEGNARAYTRANYVVINNDALSKSNEDLEHTIVHELFHVLSRNNPKLRQEMYGIIGFDLMNTIEYPEGLKKYRMTNPDAPQTDSYIKLKVDGQIKDCMIILYSAKDYSGGNLFDYLNVGFLSLSGDTIKTIEYNDNIPVIYTFEEVTEFFEQVGKNTKYIIHPEEILADNFTFAILNKTELPNPEIINEIKKKLQK